MYKKLICVFSCVSCVFVVLDIYFIDVCDCLAMTEVSEQMSDYCWCSELLDFWTCPSSRILNIRKSQCFRNRISFCAKVKGGRHLLCWVP
jgi:hypothetical protein